MKFIKGILYTILGIFALLCALVLLFAFNPKLTDMLSDLLYGNGQTEEITEDPSVATSDFIGEPEERVTTAPEQNMGETDASGNGSEAGDIINKLPEKDQYIEPEESQIQPPEEVAGKTGYQPITPQEEEVQDQEGEELAKTLGYGETGDGLTFDPAMYPYYNMLDDKLQHLYRQIYANAEALNQSFAPIEDVSASQLKNAFTAVFCDQPQLFWLDTAYACKNTPAGKCVEIDLQFNNTAQDLDSSKQSFQSAANEIISGASGLGSDYDKEVYVHDALLDNITYNLGAPMNQSAYSALVNGQTVCAGYARAFQYIMEQMGIPCYYCMGYAGESHAWNIISLDDGYYNVDSTWDDTEPNTYDYFNKSDNDFNQNHKRTDLSVYLPACNGSKYSNLEENPESAAESQTQPNETGQETPQMTGNEPGNNLRTLEDTGFTPENVIGSLEDYYADCAKQLQENGLGNYEFQNVIQDRSLYNELYLSYRDQDYKSAYAENVMEQLGAQNFNLKMRIEELSNRELLLTHHVTMN